MCARSVPAALLWCGLVAVAAGCGSDRKIVFCNASLSANAGGCLGGASGASSAGAGSGGSSSGSGGAGGVGGNALLAGGSGGAAASLGGVGGTGLTATDASVPLGDAGPDAGGPADAAVIP